MQCSTSTCVLMVGNLKVGEVGGCVGLGHSEKWME